jgi:predicted HD superfamily hydrolase involved in NAD metabolism
MTSPIPEYSGQLERDVIQWVRRRESSKRFAHTERVVAEATQLAETWAPHETMVCRMAGWIHDAAKHVPPQDLLEFAMLNDIPVSPAELETPMLLHGIVGYHKAAKKFGIDDDRIRTACAYHTTGSPHMNLTDKIVFLADLIEPERDFPMVDVIRQMAYIDINNAMLISVDNTMRYLLTRMKPIDPRVLLLYNVLIKERPSEPKVM